VKCRGRSLAIDNNEFLPSSVCVGSEIINWIATNAIGNYYHTKSTRVTSQMVCDRDFHDLCPARLSPPGGSFGEIRRTGIWRTIPVESLTTSVSRSGTYDDNCNRYVFCY